MNEGLTLRREDFDPTFVPTFWARVDVDWTNRDKCWEWIGARDGKQYGKVGSGGLLHTTSRVAYALTNGITPGDLVVRHTCDNPPCCNPRHLLTGTQSDNAKDASERGRLKIQRGSENEMAKLTPEQVAGIRVRFAAGETNINRLAKEFGISWPCMKRLVLNRSYVITDEIGALLAQ